MFTQQNAYDAIIKLSKTKGNIRAALIERMFRLETAHFTSYQYAKTGSAGMEKGAWPNIPNRVSYVKLRDNQTQRLVDFIVWENVYDFCTYLSDYIDRHGGNYARWNSTNYRNQRIYGSLVNNVRNKWINGNNPYLSTNYIPSQTGVTEQVRPPADKVMICKKDSTIQEFIDENNILMTVDNLMKYSENSKNIYGAYNQLQKNLYKEASKELIVNGTRVTIPMYQIGAPKSIYAVNQTIIENLKYKAFVEKEVRKMFDNPDYKKINTIDTDLDGSKEYGSLYKKMNNISVWVWSKSLDIECGSELIDITPFIIDIDTSVGDNGGNFTFTLPNITFDKLPNGDMKLPIVWMNDEYYNAYLSKNSLHNITEFDSYDLKCDFKDDNEVLKSNGQILTRNSSYFKTILQKNDMVFIRFERLKMDKVYGIPDNGQIGKVSSSDLPDNVYDMIGLIDDVVDSTNNAEQSERQITIMGRDMSKIVIDDSVYNFIVGYGSDKEELIQNSNADKSTGRTVIEVDKQQFNVGGAIMGDNEFNFFQTHSIDEWMAFIFSQLTNITIAPDNLFNSYKERSFITSRQNSMNSSGDFTYKKTLADGVWQIVKLCFDYETTKRRLADDSLSTNTGSLINMIRKFAQMPFVETIMDTYGDKYYFNFRKPPFSLESFKTNPCLNLFEGDIISADLDFDTEYYSMFELNAMGSLIETTDGQNLINLPAVMFRELSKLFGLRSLSVVSNYLDFDMSVSNLTESNLQHLQEQFENDMDWMIKSHVYLPFSRRGTITMKGDRRYKRGMNVRMFSTGEVYYINSVANYANFSSDSNDRRTTIEVSRGIVEKDIEKYFNLVNTLKEKGKKTRWEENVENIKYFIERRQFR